MITFSDELPPDRVNHRLETRVRPELLVDPVQVIAQRLRRDAEFPLDVGRAEPFREAPQHALFLPG